MRNWFLLFRPWSYTATLVPFLLGGALAAAMTSAFRVDAMMRWTLGLAAGLLFQAAANLLNTWGDERSGVDAVPGAIRTTPQVYEGKISMRALFAVAMVCLALAVAIGVALCFYKLPPIAYRMRDLPPGVEEWRFSWRLLGLGIIGALGAVNYSTGIKFKYHGLGVPFVSLLMGPLEIMVALAVAVPWFVDHLLCGLVAGANVTAYVMFLYLAAFFVLSAPVALLVGVIMHGNDMRDMPTDRAAGIVTLATRLGPRRALNYYRFCHVCPYVIIVAAVLLFCALDPRDAGNFVRILLPCLALPLSIRTIREAARIYRERPESPKWRGLERASGLVHLVFGALYAISLWILC